MRYRTHLEAMCIPIYSLISISYELSEHLSFILFSMSIGTV